MTVLIIKGRQEARLLRGTGVAASALIQKTSGSEILMMVSMKTVRSHLVL